MNIEVIYLNDYCQYDLLPCNKSKCLEEDCPRFPKQEQDRFLFGIGSNHRLSR
jgi:hypothetical protein